MVHQFYLVLINLFIIIKLIHCSEQSIQTDNHVPSSLCSINRNGFGQLEHVELTSHSINLQLKKVYSNVQCSSIQIYASIINLHTNENERIIKGSKTSSFHFDELLANHNYSITLKFVDENNNIRILPTYIFQTLDLLDENVVTLSNNDILSIDQIESFVFPQSHLYLVTLSSDTRRSNIFANISISYEIKQRQYKQHSIVKPLDNNVLSPLGRVTSKTIGFSIELPYENDTSIEYTSSIHLFYSNDKRQSIVDHPIIVKYPQPITVDFLPISMRSIRVSIQHLCSSYIEVKGTIYNDLKAITRSQCDINKKENSFIDITNGLCTMLFDKLDPEVNYTLSIRATCPLTMSPSLTYIFYDRTRNFPFEIRNGIPDDDSLILLYHNENRTLSWKSQSRNETYLGPDHYYELYSKSFDNWTLIYRGNKTAYQLTSKIVDKGNLTFRIYVSNRYGRQESNYTEIHVSVQSLRNSSSTNQIMFYMVLTSFLLLILFVFLFIGCYVRNKKIYGKLRKKYCQNNDLSDKELEHLRSLTYCNTLKENILYTWNYTPTNVDISKLPRIERMVIKLDRLIGKGAFGEVYAGTMSNSHPVAVKTLLSSATPEQRVDFLKEAIIMNQFNHKHILHLLGVCFHNDYQPQFLVIELMEQGDLQNFLRRSRPTKENDKCQLNYENCLDIAKQIADGACYLEQHSYVHRDLAARNCLVSKLSDKEIIVKIGDFGLARMLSQQDYYRKTGEALLPVRWMAPESLLDAIFTSQSDIWSFGIVLWEIITLGQVPYSPLSNQQVISLITTTRGTLEKPIQCTQVLYDLMLACWDYIPENRIHFLDIYARLNEILFDEAKEQPIIWFSNETSSSTARNVLDCVLSHIEPPTSISFEGSDVGECRSSTSGCFSSMTESTSQIHNNHILNRPVSSYQLRLIDDTTSNDYADEEDDHSDVIVRS